MSIKAVPSEKPVIKRPRKAPTKYSDLFVQLTAADIGAWLEISAADVGGNTSHQKSRILRTAALRKGLRISVFKAEDKLRICISQKVKTNVRNA